MDRGSHMFLCGIGECDYTGDSIGEAVEHVTLVHHYTRLYLDEDGIYDAEELQHVEQ